MNTEQTSEIIFTYPFPRNFFGHIIKSSFETSRFYPKEVEPRLKFTQYLEKRLLHVNTRIH